MSDQEEVVVLQKRRRVSRKIPFGYYVDPDDTNILVPDLVLYEHILTIRDMRKAGSTLGECVEYLKAHTGAEYSRMDCKRIIERKY